MQISLLTSRMTRLHVLLKCISTHLNYTYVSETYLVIYLKRNIIQLEHTHENGNAMSTILYTNYTMAHQKVMHKTQLLIKYASNML